MSSATFRTIRSAAVLAAVAAGSAHADLILNFTYQDSVTAGSGWLSVLDNGNGSFTALDGAFDVSTGPVAGSYTLFANPTAPSAAYSPSGAFIYDNLVYPTGGPALDNSGLLFASAGREINLWGNGSSPYSLWSHAGGGYDYSHDDGTFSVTSTPAPGGVAVLGFAGLVAVRRRRR